MKNTKIMDAVEEYVEEECGPSYTLLDISLDTVARKAFEAGARWATEQAGCTHCTCPCKSCTSCGEPE